MGFFSDIFKGFTNLLGDIIGFLVGVDFDDFEDQAKGALVNKQSNIDPIPVVYGQRKIGGVRVFVSTGGGKKNEYLFIALVLCEGEIQAIDEVYINDKISTHSDYSGLLQIDKKLGTDNQTASTVLIGSGNDTPDDTWGSNHRLRGVAYLGIRIKYDQDVFGGIPDIQCVVRGKKVYDPRTATTAYSTNPALCLRDYLTNTRYGKGLPASAINDTMFEAAADDYDAATVSPYSGGSGINLIDCNARLDTGKTIFNNVKELLQGMRGLMPYSEGKYGLIFDQATSSTFNLTPENITSQITVQNAGKGKRFNRVIAKFPNPDANWQLDSVTFPKAGSADETTFLAEDNDEELIKELQLNTITSIYQARDIARIVCLASRKNVNAVSLRATSEALNIAIGDVVNLEHPSLGWTGAATQNMRVVSTQLLDSGEVNLSLLEYNGSIYPFAQGDEAEDNQETTLPDPFEVGAPQTPLTLTEGTSVAGDGTVFPSITVTWTAADDAFVDEYEVQYKLTADANFSGYVRTVDTEAELVGLVVGSEYTIRVRSINALGVRSSFISATVTLAGDSTAPAVPTSMTVTGSFKSIILAWTNPADNDFSHVEIKRSPNATEGNATTIASTSSDTFTDEPFTGSIERYYWLRSIDTSGNASAWVLAGNATSIPLVSNDIDNNIIELDNFVQDLIDDFNAKADAADVLNVQIETGEVLDLETGQDVLIQNLGDVAIFVNESNQTINNSINTTNTTLANLEATVVDLTSGTSDIFVSASAPVAGVGGVPDPIPIFSRWYDSDDNNEPYYWDGSAWQSLADPRIASNAASITTLQSGLNTANSNISANSTAITALDTTTVSQGNSITTLTSDVTTLQSDLTSAESNITTNATAITNLTTRVTDNEGDITSITSDVTTLQTDVTAAEGNITTNTSAISGLTTRVTTAEGNITTNASDITALETTVNDGTTGVAANASAISGLDTRITTAEGTITTQSSDITALENTVNDATTGVAANATALSSLDTRVTTAEGSITSQASDITQLQTDVTSAEGDIVTNASAITSLDTRITTAENDITSLSASNITALEVSVDDLTLIQDESDNAIQTEGGDDLLLNLPTDVASATSTATNALDSRITLAEGTITVQSSDITSLQSTLTTAEGNITSNASAISALSTRVTSAEGTITSQSSDITTLQSDLTDAESDITTNASAISALDTRVTTAEGTITSQSTDITTLQSDLTDAEGDILTNASAITSLTTRVTTAEGTITSQSSDITALENTVNNPTTGVSANASAISGLDTRVTSAEGTITTQSSDITNLETTVNNPTTGVSANATAISGLDTRLTSAEGTITSQSSDITALESTVNNGSTGVAANASAVSSLDTRVTSAEGSITSNSSSITQLQTDVNTAEGNINTNSTAISGLDTRVTTAEGSITSQAADITALQSDLTDAESDISTNTSAISSLTTRVTNAEGTITSNSSSITTLQSNLATAEGDITANASAVSGLDTRVTSAEGSITTNASNITSLTSTIEDPTTGLAATATVASGASTTASANSTAITNLEAEAYLTVSAGGNVSGFKATAGASGSSFTIQADQFALVSDDESQTTTPFAVNSVDGTVTFNADVDIDGDLIVSGTVDVAQYAAGSLGLIDGITNVTDDIFTYTELFRTAFDGDVPHIADTTVTNSTDSNPAITQNVSILGNSPIMTFNFSTHDWGAGTRPFLLNFIGNVSSGVSGAESEMVIALVLRKTTSSSAYTSTTASSYAFTTRKSTSGVTATVGTHQLGGKVNLDSNSEYYAWLFMGAEPAAGSLGDATISIAGINK